jgi:hypothetical protein
MALGITTFTAQASKARGSNSAAWVSAGFNLPANALILVLVGACGFSSGALPGSDIRCTVAGYTVTQKASSPSSSTWMYGSAVFSFQTTTSTTGTTMSFDFWNGSTLQPMNTWQLQVIAFTGFDTSTPTLAYVNGTSATGTGAGSVTLSSSPTSADYVIGLWHALCNTVGSITATQGSGFTEVMDDYDDDYAHMEVEYVTGVTSTTVAWTQLGTPSGVAAEGHMIGFIVKAATGGGNSYSVSIAEAASGADSPSTTMQASVSATEAATALDSPNRAGGASYSVSASEAATGAEVPSAVSQLAAAIAEAMSGADSSSLPTAFTKTLVYEAYNASGSNTVVSGSLTFTCSAGDTILVGFAGFANADQGACSDSVHGTIGRITGAFNAWSNSSQTYGGFAAIANVSAGSHTVTLPTITSGQDAVFYIWHCSGLSTTLTVTSKGKTHQVSSSKNCTVTTDLPVAAGDQAFGMRFHENSVGSTDTLTRPSGWAQEGTDILDGAVILPTNCASLSITSGSSTLSGLWTSADNSITDTSAAIVVFTPTSSGSTQSVSISESGTGAETQSATGALSSTISEAGSAVDAPSSAKATASSIVEAGSAAESAIGTYSTNASISETASGGDSGSSTTTLTASASEAATAADSKSATYVATASGIESGTAAESQVATGSLSTSQSDSGAASELLDSTRATSGTVSEVGSASELITADGNLVQAAISEGGAAAESESANMTTSLGIIESLAASELQSCIGTFYGSVVEALSAADSATVGSVQLAQMIESGAMSEAQDAIKAISADVLEAIALTDYPAAAFAAVCQAIETGDVQDVESATAIMTTALIEAVAAFDFVDGAKAQFVTIGELLTAVDQSSAAFFVSSLIRMYRFAEETRLYSFEDDSRRYRFPSENVRTYQFSGEARNYRFKDGG